MNFEEARGSKPNINLHITTDIKLFLYFAQKYALSSIFGIIVIHEKYIYARF